MFKVISFKSEALSKLSVISACFVCAVCFQLLLKTYNI